MSNDNLLHNIIQVPWNTAHHFNHPDSWSGIMSGIEGAQNALICVDVERFDEVVADLQFLWAVALKLRGMAYENE